MSDPTLDLAIDLINRRSVTPDDAGCQEFYVTVHIEPLDQPRSSVLQPWVEQLGLRHQGVLMAGVRGCDSVPKEDATKALARCFRATILRSFGPKPSSFIEFVDDEELRKRMVAVLKNHDHYPIHFILHLMHGSEIIGYKWPDPAAVFWHWFYEKLAQCFHLNVETEEQLDARLGACETKFAAHSTSIYQPTASPHCTHSNTTESNHFKFEIIPAGRWSRVVGTTPIGGSNETEARPHLVPKTGIARQLVSIDAGGFIGRTGLCPGEVTLDDGSKTLAYRFLAGFPEAEASQLLDQLDEIIRDMKRAAKD